VLNRSGNDVDRLQQLRAVLPCQVRVTGPAHPLFGQVLEALSFKRIRGVVYLVVTLPDGSPGTIRADVTDVLGPAPQSSVSVLLDADGVRELHRLLVTLGHGSAGRGGRGRGRK